MFESPQNVGFPTTCWSRVIHAGDPADPSARGALEGLCRDYWYPLYAFVRRQGVGPDDAGDIVQGFLADLIERRDLATADPARGRFRSFLRAACAHYLAHRRDHDRAAVRGGGRRAFTIDVSDAEQRLCREAAHQLTAERLFERRWALDLLGRVLARLEAEAVQSGKGELVARLKPTLEGDDRAESYRAVGAALGRARYRELLREEVARTVDDPAEIDRELDDLIAALAN
jgi:RNA polymerase sigma-70 factor (ECF subfamily)